MQGNITFTGDTLCFGKGARRADVSKRYHPYKCPGSEPRKDYHFQVCLFLRSSIRVLHSGDRTCFGETLNSKEVFDQHHKGFQSQVMDPFVSYIGKAYRESGISFDIASLTEARIALNIRKQLSLERFSGDADAMVNDAEDQSSEPIVIDCSVDPSLKGASEKKAASTLNLRLRNRKSKTAKGRDDASDDDDDSGEFDDDDDDDDDDNDDDDDEAQTTATSKENSGRSKIPKTPYELEREKTIARNQALLEELGIGAAVAAVTHTRKKSTKTVKPAGQVAPTRRSARISSSHLDEQDDTIDVPHPPSPREPDSSGDNEGSRSASADVGGPSAVASIDVPQPPSPGEPDSSGDNEGNRSASPDVGRPIAVASQQHDIVELTLPLGVSSNVYEEQLAVRQRLLSEPEPSEALTLQPLPHGGVDTELFPLFDLNEVDPAARIPAGWIVEAEKFLCGSLAGYYAKHAIRHWLTIEEKLCFPTNVSLSCSIFIILFIDRESEIWPSETRPTRVYCGLAEARQEIRSDAP